MLFYILKVFLLAFMFWPSIAGFSFSASALDKFRNHTPLKKLSVQSLATFRLFKDQFMKRLIKSEITSEEMKQKLMAGIQKTEGEEKTRELFSSVGPDEDPQMHLEKLAFMYAAMNRADFASATSITRICTVEGLLRVKENENACTTYPTYLLKLIELRISIVTSRVIYSEGLVGIPKGWVDQVQSLIKEMEMAGLLSESLRNLLFLLQGIAKKTEEVDQGLAENLLHVPKIFPDQVNSTSTGMGIPSLSSSSFFEQQHHHHHPTRITIDARNLTKELSKRQQSTPSNPNSSNETLNSMISQMLPKMIM
jgi:hypothetical protein